MKKVISVISCFVFILLAGVTLVACGNNKTSSLVYDKKQEDFSMVVSVDQENVNINIQSEASTVGRGKATLIGMKAFEYYQADAFKGLSQNIVNGGGIPPLVNII